MAQPSFKMMWDAFPDHVQYPTLRDLHNFVGGQLARNIDVPGFGAKGNTCAVRISRALNYGNTPLSYKRLKALELNPLLGADRKLYLFRVRELKIYLADALAVTPKRVKKDFTSAFAGVRGIVTFDVDGWSDASGHVALWDGSSFREPAFDDFRGLKDDPATAAVEASVTAMRLWAL
jgi:hypothetical protein